jgi:hypothetical protein
MVEKKKQEMIKWFKTTGSLSEIYQQNKIQFSFLSSPETGHMQCHPWVLCRDFLHDAVKAEVNKNKQGIYGFTFTGGTNPPVDLEKMRMLVRHQNVKKAKDFQDRIDRALEMIHRFEKIGGLKKSKVMWIEKADTSTPVWLFTGSRRWIRSPFMVSLYSYLIRLGTYDNLVYDKKNTTGKILKETVDKNKSATDNDISYLRRHFDKLEKIMAHHKELFYKSGDLDDRYTKNLAINTFHNYSGILNLCTLGSQDNDLNKRVAEVLKRVDKPKRKAVSKKTK